MRVLVPVIVPWLCMYVVVATVYLLEARRARERRVANPETGQLPKGPNLRFHLLAALLVGPLLASLYFWSSRRKAIGLFFGLGLKTSAVMMFVGVQMLTRDAMLTSTIRAAHAACMTDGPLASSPEAVTREGPCGALFSAYDSGVGCLDGDELVVCSLGGSPFDVDRNPETARTLLHHRCAKRRELAACVGTLALAGEDPAAKTRAIADIQTVCCTWWQDAGCSEYAERAACQR
jgi:hypothetical protein